MELGGCSVHLISTTNPQVFVITSQSRMTPAESEAFRSQWRELLGKTELADVPVLFLLNGQTVAIIEKCGDVGNSAQKLAGFYREGRVPADEIRRMES